MRASMLQVRDGMRLWQLELDLWPAGIALTVAMCLIGLLLIVDRVARAAASRRTQRALQRTLIGAVAQAPRPSQARPTA
jgi:hypothetical protein